MSDFISREELQALRSRAIVLTDTVHLQHSATELWPHLADKNAISKVVGMGPADYLFEPDAHGGSRIFVKSKLMGIVPVHFRELSYEWIPPYYSAVERIFINGPLRYLKISWKSRDREKGGCELKVSISYLSRFLLMPMQPMVKSVLNKMLAFHADTNKNLPAYSSSGVETPMSPELRRQIDRLHAEWRHLLPAAKVAEALAEYLYTMPDRQTARLRPFEIAEHSHLPRMEVLRFCLLATREGFLGMNWELICPSCQRPAEKVPHLSGLKPEAHCEACNIRYDANFDQNVEVTFRPAARLRKFSDKIYCMLNPGALPHIHTQLIAEPNTERELDISLPTGQYRLYCPGLEGELTWHSSAEQETGKLSLRLQGCLSDGLGKIGNRLHLKLHNPEDFPRVLRIERQRHREIAATAALVTSLQDFRSLFSAEVLKPGLKLGVSNLAVLFSDLKDSTRLYENKGDASAFALVQTHFDIMEEVIRTHEGGVVKTIGDAVMAVFTDNRMAVCAALDILKRFQEYNQGRSSEEQIIIKLGIHKGPCIALNQNDKLDYFGSNINRAARTQGKSRGDDLVLSQEMYQDAEVQSCLRREAAEVTTFSAELKGIQQAQTLYCVRLPLHRNGEKITPP
ncbi:MAG: adenylate/guanylate cyclase domain-containing protein [Gammaproteobacteria bacterium]|nr:adenylate/guanylate cyclase domain-containing protein [Gammaproteobacteria bacterium]